MSCDRDDVICVLGATGQLGLAVRSRVDSGWFPSRDEVDLARLDVGKLRDALTQKGCEALINCAAYTAVDRAESEEHLATSINGLAVGAMAAVCAELDIPFVTFSTDYVFSGVAANPYVESSPTGPVNAYGRGKLVGEERALGVGRALVVRTSWLISGTHPNFVSTMLRLGSTGRSLKVVADQRGRPTCVEDLAAATLRALTSGASGLLHLSNVGPEATWYQLAGEALRIAGIDARVEPCTSEEYPTPAARPAYSVLGTERSGTYALESMPSWLDSLPSVVNDLMASAAWQDASSQ